MTPRTKKKNPASSAAPAKKRTTRAGPRTKKKRAKKGPRQRRLYRLAVGSLAVLLAPVVALLVWAALPGPGTGRQVAVDWPGTVEGARAAGERLARAGLVKSPRLFAAYLKLVRPSLELSAGPHLLQDDLSPRDLVQRLARLPGRPKVQITIPEGYNYLQVGERLEHLEVCSSGAFQSAVKDRALLDKLRIRGPSAEGYLFPATYRFHVDCDPVLVVRRLVSATRHRLRKLGRLHDGAIARLRRKRGWGQREILTLASIIEKETAQSGERRLVASVYYNRLDDPDFRPLHTLQADPTAGYGCLIEPEAAASCAGYSGHITPAMLRDPDNRYNTYRHPGLPPGPIANPGEGAIAAVLDPARTQFLFFVASGTGGHTFSRTFDEHNAAIKKTKRDAGP